MVANYAENPSEQQGHDVSCRKIGDLTSCHESCYDNKQTNSCHDHVMFDKEKKISLSDYNYLVNQLEAWKVFAPRAVVKRYGALNAWEAMNRTKDFQPRIPGAYFTKVIRSLTGMNGKRQEVQKREECTVLVADAYRDYKSAQLYLSRITDADLNDPQVAINVHQLKAKWNFA